MRVLLVEDDHFHASYLQDVIAEALPEVTETVHASDGIAGQEEARAGAIEAIVMDLQMDRRNGVEAARTIWAERPGTRILFWSNYSDEAYLRGVSAIVPPASAYGYVLKTATRARLKLALRAVLIEGQIIVDREVHRLQRKGPGPLGALDAASMRCCWTSPSACRTVTSPNAAACRCGRCRTGCARSTRSWAWRTRLMAFR